MPATITSQFRKNNAKNLIADGIAADQSYWIGIGKSDEWPAVAPSTSADVSIPYPNSSVDYSAVTLENLISLKKSVAGAYVSYVPRLMITANVWAVGRKYKVYDSGNDECFIPQGSSTAVEFYPCHVSVISGSFEYFFLCVGVFKTSTALDPASTSGSDPYTQYSLASGSGGYGISDNADATVGKILNTSDGYRWVYLYRLSVTETFNMDHFKCLPSSNSTNGLTLPNSAITDAYCANIFAIRIDNAGTQYSNSGFKIILHYSGYNSTPTAVTGSVVYDAITSLASDRFSLSKYIKNATGSITYISAPKIPITVKYITRATISIITTGASDSAPMLLTPILTPIDATKDLSAILPCWYVAFYAKFNPDADASRSSTTSQPSDIITVNDYRQISLIKNPISSIPTTDNTADNTDNSMDCLRYFAMSTTGAQVLTDTSLSLKIYQCDASGNLFGGSDANEISAEAHLDYISTVGGVTRVYFHQNYTGVNVKNFYTASGSFIKFGFGSNTTYSYTSIVEPEYKRGTGQVLFVENRHLITRNPNQSEEIKLIIQL